MFIYPLCKKIHSNANRKSSMSKNEHNNSSMELDSCSDSRFESSGARSTIRRQTIKKSGNRKKNAINQRLKKWLALSTICFASDVISASVILIFWRVVSPASIMSSPFLFLWHDVSIAVNVVCMICCFKEYPSMLFPFRHKVIRKREPSQILSAVRPPQNVLPADLNRVKS